MSNNHMEQVEKRSIKRDRFIRIAERRVNQVLEKIENLSKCSNKANYEYTEDDVRRIFKEIERKVRETKSLFQGKTPSRRRFKL